MLSNFLVGGNVVATSTVDAATAPRTRPLTTFRTNTVSWAEQKPGWDVVKSVVVTEEHCRKCAYAIHK